MSWELGSFEKQINAPKSAIYCCPPEALPNFQLHGIKLVAKIQLCIYKRAHLSNVTALTAACETGRGVSLPGTAGCPIHPAALCSAHPWEEAQPQPPPAPLAAGRE